jgi:hypothetical protein
MAKTPGVSKDPWGLLCIRPKVGTKVHLRNADSALYYEKDPQEPFCVSSVFILAFILRCAHRRVFARLTVEIDRHLVEFGNPKEE